MVVAFQLEGAAAVPLNVTVLVPCVPPKFVPVIVTDVPTAAEVGLRLLMVAVACVCCTVNAIPLLVMPPTFTTTLPLVAPAGTGATILVEFQPLGVPAMPLNITVLVPCVLPKFVPAIVTGVPTVTELGLKLEIPGGCGTVNATPLLATPPTVTTTFPLVAPAGTATAMPIAFQPTGVADVPLNVTVLVPCEVPKFVPVIVTEVPTAASAGLTLLIWGAVGGFTVMPKPWLAPR